jgi:hypothetical protein
MPGTFGIALALHLASASAATGPAPAGGLEIVASGNSIQCVFGGARCAVSVLVYNRRQAEIVAQLHLRLYQASSATVAPFTEITWKELHVLRGQTLLEEFSIDLPAVRGETSFIVQCLDEGNRIIGTVPLLVYPAGLLENLKTMGDNKAVGVFDPQSALRPSLQAASVDIVDFEPNVMRAFTGRLAILAPRDVRSQNSALMFDDAMALAKRGVGVVLLWPAPQVTGAIRPSFRILPRLPGCVVVAQAELVRDLATRPQAQLNLLQLCRAALNPALFDLPET